MRFPLIVDIYLGVPTEYPNTFNWIDLSPVYGVDGFRAHMEHEVVVEAQPVGGQVRGVAKIYISKALQVSRFAPNSIAPFKIAERHNIDGEANYYGFLRSVTAAFSILHAIEWRGN